MACFFTCSVCTGINNLYEAGSGEPGPSRLLVLCMPTSSWGLCPLRWSS